MLRLFILASIISSLILLIARGEINFILLFLVVLFLLYIIRVFLFYLNNEAQKTAVNFVLDIYYKNGKNIDNTIVLGLTEIANVKSASSVEALLFAKEQGVRNLAILACLYIHAYTGIRESVYDTIMKYYEDVSDRLTQENINFSKDAEL